MKFSLLAALFMIFIVSSQAVYLPGVAPTEYEDEDPVPLKVNKMVSSRKQVPYPYYSLKFCTPDTIIDFAENLGEILMGDKIENSPYTLLAGVDFPCRVLCTNELDLADLNKFDERIKQDYRINWIVDGLPAATKRILKDITGKSSFVYDLGFHLGFHTKTDTYINNHVSIKILFHKSEEFVGMRIVGFEVEPRSIAHNWNGPNDTNTDEEFCQIGSEFQRVSGFEEPIKMTWTYSVTWEYDELKWSSRWDVYLKMNDPQIHWFSIINSVMIVLFLTGMVAMIMMRTLKADFRRYRDLQSQEEAQEETGWKLVHGDVFRAPSHPMALSVLYGSGVQVLFMVLITLILALFGFLSPANRGALMSAGVVLYIFMGIVAGYASARLYKTLKGTEWKKNTILTSIFFPAVVFSIFFVVNVFLAREKSSGYVHFGTLVSLLALWFGISIPLAFFGSYLGFKKEVEEFPVRTNQIPRQVPEQVWYMKPVVSILMGGILPFGAVFIELFFILSSIWQHQFYYMFTFLFIVFVILVVTCAEITIVMCYFQLCSEDYHWWWRSYLTSGSSAVYLLLYAVFYYFTKLEMTGLISTLVYFAYTFIFSLGFFVLTGAVGFYSCYLFVEKIYSAVKFN